MKARDATRRFFSRPLPAGRAAGHARQIPRWFWLVAAAWLAWVAIISEHSFWRIAQLRREISQAEAEGTRLRNDTARLHEQVGDPEAKRFRAEEIARTQHGWAAPGEIVYRFRGNAPRPDSSSRP